MDYIRFVASRSDEVFRFRSPSRLWNCLFLALLKHLQKHKHPPGLVQRLTVFCRTDLYGRLGLHTVLHACLHMVSPRAGHGPHGLFNCPETHLSSIIRSARLSAVQCGRRLGIKICPPEVSSSIPSHSEKYLILANPRQIVRMWNTQLHDCRLKPDQKEVLSGYLSSTEETLGEPEHGWWAVVMRCRHRRRTYMVWMGLFCAALSLSLLMLCSSH